MFAMFSRQKMYSDCAKNFHYVTGLSLDRCKEFVTNWVPTLKEIHSNSPVNPKHHSFIDFACYTLIHSIISDRLWNRYVRLNTAVCINYIAGMERILGRGAELPAQLRQLLEIEAAEKYSAIDIEALHLIIDRAVVAPGYWLFPSFLLSLRDKLDPPKEEEVTLYFGQYKEMAERLRADNMKRVQPVYKGKLKPGQFSVTRNDKHTFTIRICKRREESVL